MERRQTIREVEGYLTGLKASHKKRLSALFRRRIPRNEIAPPLFLRALTEISREIERQIGVLIDRQGRIERFIVGDAYRIEVPDLGRLRMGQDRFRGLRLIHTHLDDSPLSQEDLHDLILSRLDLIAVVESLPNGLPGNLHYAHLLPENPTGQLWNVHGPLTPQELEREDFLELISSLESEFTRAISTGTDVDKKNRAILIGVYDCNAYERELRMNELAELAHSANLNILSRVLQRRDRPDPRYMLGRGKLQDLVMKSMQLGAELLVFDANLTPTQSRNIAEETDLKILDRTQLILDIFAQRAHSRDGKLQVELAQLKYMLPHLTRKNTAMSRLVGGIGGRGPGETKLEVDRRRAYDRINRLEKALKKIRKQRHNRRRRRQSGDTPIVSIVGYTNAGKSTLLNTLTSSEVRSEDLMFSTLDPVSRHIYLPSGQRVILTDTVGFIRDLPPDLVAAFQATLEELEDAQLFLHIVDISDSTFQEQITSVEKILGDLELQDTPRIIVFNKTDRIEEEECINLCHRYQAVGVSAISYSSLHPLLEALESQLTWFDEEVECVRL